MAVDSDSHELPDKTGIRDTGFRDRYSLYRASIDCENNTEIKQRRVESVREKFVQNSPEIKKRSQENETVFEEADEESEEEMCDDTNSNNSSSAGFQNAESDERILSDILRKAGRDRSEDELETLHEELVHIKALNHLSNSVKRELGSVIFFQDNFHKEDIVFEQGDVGDTWYIILRGSVQVVIRGKGVVTTLREGDEFGQLALVNDAPRAATIIVAEDGTHLLRVDKSDFNRILRDVEANILRLKEHGKDVLVLETSCTANSQFKYSVIEGCPSKMVEYLLETRLDNNWGDATDLFLDDFLLTHIIFMPTRQLIRELRKQMDVDRLVDDESLETSRRRVVYFLHRWIMTIGFPIIQEPLIYPYIMEIYDLVSKDLNSEAVRIMKDVIEYHNCSLKVAEKPKLWNCIISPQPVCLTDDTELSGKPTNKLYRRSPIRPNDDVIFRVYSIGHTYCTLRVPINSTVEDIKHVVTQTCGLQRDDSLLLELKSTGTKVLFKDSERSIITSLSVNGRIFIASKLHLDALTCLAEQESTALDSERNDVQTFSTRLLAYHLTMYDWSLFKCVHEYELIYRTTTCEQNRNSNTITSNLDIFLQRFNIIQFWVVSTICTTLNVDKRTMLLSKFIKLASYCKEYKNLNGCFAVVMGLSNSAVTRLSQTWDKLPLKSRKVFSELERLIEPSRNHRPYRLAVQKLSPPFIPFMPLLLKDITFVQEGNRNYKDVSDNGLENNETPLVNFEKMHMIAQVLRIFRVARSSDAFPTALSGSKDEENVMSYVKNIRCIDNEESLRQLSLSLQPRELPKQDTLK